MPDDTLNLRGLYMPRHPPDVIGVEPPVLASIDQIAHSLFGAVSERYRDPPEPRWDEIDRYWAGEHAAFMMSQKLHYMQFLPGKYFTYKVLTDILGYAFQEANIVIKGAKVAEVGCGSALWSLMLAQRGVEPSLFDKSYCGLEYAKFLAGPAHFNVRLKEFRQGDFYSLPSEWTGYFDAVVAGGVLEHLSPLDQNRYLKEAFRILKPGGIIAFTMPNPHSPLNISSDTRKSWFFDAIKRIGNWLYTIPLPMVYNKEGGLRLMNEMTTANGFVVQEEDAVLLAPSTPLERRFIKGNPIAEGFYGRIETMCNGDLINPEEDGKARVEALIHFWDMIGESLRPEERIKIARWMYIVGRKPGTSG